MATVLVGAVTDSFGFRPAWPWGHIAGMIEVGVGISVGIVLGRLAGERLFRPRD
jgi:hypothetical protein